MKTTKAFSDAIAQAALEMAEQNVQSTAGALSTGTTGIAFAFAITKKEDADAVGHRLAEAFAQFYSRSSQAEGAEPAPPAEPDGAAPSASNLKGGSDAAGD